ncbi:TonB-dependent receptor [Sphingorhabdus arenilitoris]|uniref:TonB-dependent receptor n=1 Tax=Sphingorhabdus arenilitoris TaxID=1490041 RepID=A0ABV8RFE9_9SPHN
MRKFNRLLTAALCSSMLIPATSYAQEAQSDEQGARSDDVIIVTATRRAEDVQDIPLAVTAVSPVQLERQGVVNVQQLSQVSTSFSASNAQISSGSIVLRIRGVGTTSNNIGFESAVGIFIDGAYQSRPGVALSEFVDVERVEVLRGPQGTLFGRNTSAGALTVTNVRPDLDEFGGFANASYGNFNLINVQGAVNVPVVKESLALRVTGSYRKRDGFVDIRGVGGAKVGESNDADQYLIRGQLGFDFGGIDGRIIADYSQSKASCCTAIELLPAASETSGLLNAFGLGATGGQFQDNRGLQAVDDRISSANFQPIGNVKNYGVTGEVNIPIGENADLIYIGSYREFKARETYDTDFTALDLFNVDLNNTRINTMTHELRLQGEALGGKLEYLVGGYYSTEDIRQEVSFSLGTQYAAFANASLFGLAAQLGIPSFGPTALQTLSGGANPATTRATNGYTQDSKSWSLFTNNTFSITDDLKFTVGLRYSDESKDGSYASLANSNATCLGILGNTGALNLTSADPRVRALGGTALVLGCLPFLAPADTPAGAVLPLPRSFSGKFKDNELIYTGKLIYDFGSVNAYASFTHGYKSGGFNLDSTAAIGGADPRFRSELVDAYELGLKAKLLDNAVTANLAFFLEDFTDFQVLEFTGTRFQTFNVPKARSKGFELETVIRPDDNLTVNAALTYVDAEYPNDCAGTSTEINVANLCGAPLTNAPQITGIVGATYSNEIGNSLKFFLNGQVKMESDSRTSTQPTVLPTTLAGVGTTPPLPFDIQDGNVKINLRAGIGGVDDQYAIEFWAQNLTNVGTRGVTFNTTLRTGSRSTFILEPRTFGVTVRGKF